MNSKKNRMFRSVIAMILVLAMVFSMSGTAFADTAKSQVSDVITDTEIDMSDIDFNEIYSMMESIYNDIIEEAYGDDAQNKTVTGFNKTLTAMETYLADSEATGTSELQTAIDAAQEAAVALEAATRNTADKTAASVTAAKSAMLTEAAKVLTASEKVGAANATLDKALANYENALNLLVKTLDTRIFTPDTETYSVALGDASTGASDNKGYYPFALASEMHPESNDSIVKVKKQFKNLGVDGMRAEDLLYILDPEFEGDAYSVAKFKGKTDTYTSKIKEADLITIGFSADTITKFTIDQMNAVIGGDKPYDVDWTRYLGEEEAAEMEALIEELKTEMKTMISGNLDQETIDMISMIATPETLVDAVVAGVEGYVYVLLGHMAFATSAIDEVAAINPEAEIVLVGMYNPFEGVNLVFEEQQMEIGRYIGNLIRMSNAILVDHAASRPGITYVDAANVTLNKPFAENAEMIGFITTMLGLDDELLPSSAGHAYIKDQIAGTLAMPNEELSAAAGAMAAVYTMPAVTIDNYLEAGEITAAAREAYDNLSEADQEFIGDITALTSAEAKIDEWSKVAEVQNATPEKATVSVSKTTVTASWSKVANATGYEVAVYHNGKVASTKYVTGTSLKLTNQYRGVSYKVGVTPYRTNGSKYYGNTKVSSSKIVSLLKPSVTVKKTATKFTVKAADQNSTGFQIWISKGDSKFNTKDKKITVKTSGKALSKVLKKSSYLKKGNNYIKVRSYTTLNGTTRYGSWSNSVKVKR